MRIFCVLTTASRWLSVAHFEELSGRDNLRIYAALCRLAKQRVDEVLGRLIADQRVLGRRIARAGEPCT